MLYAVKFSQPNLVLSNRVNSNSKILYDRNPRTMVEKVAPWLTVDGDPYATVVNGRIQWVLDGYTSTSMYPQSELVSLEEATRDTFTVTDAQAALPTDQVNYIRNSVKATVDAYDGTVTLYAWDPDDPILQAWREIFPGVVKDRDEMPEGALEHVRYPVDLFKVQRNILQRYHVTDPATFYEGGERWRVPDNPATYGDNESQPPYYLTMRRPGDESPNFSITSVFVPQSRDNLASFVSVNSNPLSDDYGKMQILEAPSDESVPGPNQINTTFRNDQGVTNALLRFNNNDAIQVEFGNLLTLPVEGGLLYVQPVYTRNQGASGTFPLLQYVVTSFGQRVGIGRTLEQSLQVSLGYGSLPESGDGGGDDGGDDGNTGGVENSTLVSLISRASDEYDRAIAAQKEGDWAAYGRHMELMQQLLARANQLAQGSNQNGGNDSGNGNSGNGDSGSGDSDSGSGDSGDNGSGDSGNSGGN